MEKLKVKKIKVTTEEFFEAIDRALIGWKYMNKYFEHPSDLLLKRLAGEMGMRLITLAQFIKTNEEEFKKRFSLEESDGKMYIRHKF